MAKDRITMAQIKAEASGEARTTPAPIRITGDLLGTLYGMYAELDRLKEDASSAIKAAKQNAQKPITITRKGGTEQKVTEQMLWDELWTLGKQSEAGLRLREKYPEAFAKADAQEAKLTELRAFTVLELGMDAQAVTLRDILRLIEGVVEYKLTPQGPSPDRSIGTSATMG
jgi:hypothetical protein